MSADKEKSSDKDFLRPYFGESWLRGETTVLEITVTKQTYDQGLLSVPDMKLLVPQTGTETRKSQPTGTKLCYFLW